MIRLITGGERSGKSRYAQQLALGLSPSPVYMATARKWDNDFERRINKHQLERDERWISIEEEKLISRAPLNSVVVLDCITLWLTNIYSDLKGNVEESLSFASSELHKSFSNQTDWI